MVDLNDLSNQENMLKRLTGSSGVESAIRKLKSQQVDIEKAKLSAGNSAVEKILKEYNAQDTLIKNAIASSSVANHISSISGLNEIYEKYSDIASSEIFRSSVIEGTLDFYNSRINSIYNDYNILSEQSAIAATLASISASKLKMDDLISSVISSSALEKALGVVDANKNALDILLASIASNSQATAKISQIALASTLIFQRSGDLSAMFASLEGADLSSIKLEDLEKDLENAVEAVSENSVDFNLGHVWEGFAPWIKILAIFVCLEILMPQINSISANLITPYVEEYLEGNGMPDREKIKNIRKMPASIDDSITDDLRFVTGNNVRLRQGPSTKTEILDEMSLGQVVTVLSKQRNWIEIYYESEGDAFTGWAFTNYTARFIN